MQIRSVGIDLGKTTFHLVALGDNGKGSLEEEVHTDAVGHFHSEHAELIDRDGGVRWSSLPGPCFASTRARREAYPRSVCEAVC